METFAAEAVTDISGLDPGSVVIAADAAGRCTTLADLLMRLVDLQQAQTGMGPAEDLYVFSRVIDTQLLQAQLDALQQEWRHVLNLLEPHVDISDGLAVAVSRLMALRALAPRPV